jgi:rod shape determining protein RodA
MAVVFEKPSLRTRLLPWFTGFDLPLFAVVLVLAGAGLLTMYSSGFDHGTRFEDHGRNMLIAGSIMFLVAQVPPQRLMAMAIPLIRRRRSPADCSGAVRHHQEGRARWLNVGVVIQPSEILKIAMPLMLAWWFQKREGQLRPLDFAVAGCAAGACRSA